MMPLKVTKEKVGGTRLPCSSSNSSFVSLHSSSAESLLLAGGETSVVATVMIAGIVMQKLCT